MQDAFNLVVEEWIPVLRIDGRTDYVGIRQALNEAGNIRQVVPSNFDGQVFPTC